MKIIVDYYLEKHTIEVEPSDTILDIKNKLNYITSTDHFIIRKSLYSDISGNEVTVKELCLKEGDKILLRNGYCFYINFDNKKYKLEGEGCACCKRDLLYNFMACTTGISKEDFNLVNDGIILERNLGLKKFYKKEFDLVLKENVKKVKIKYKDSYLYITYKDSLTYNEFFKLFVESHSRKLFGGEIVGNIEKLQQRFKSEINLIINGKIINENDNLNEIENLDEIIMISKSEKEA